MMLSLLNSISMESTCIKLLNYHFFFFNHRLRRFYRLFLANGFAITQVFSDLTDQKALQDFENLKLGEAKYV